MVGTQTRPAPRTINTVAELRREADAVRAAGGRVGFFGTSGNLHEGHLSLIRRMRAECELTVMPLFLVPVPGLLDFGPGTGYERDFDRDRDLAFGAGLDIAFRPTREDMYPRVPLQVRITPDKDLCYPWEGAENPAFMSMMATALVKYWNVVGPCRAYVGEKDWIPLTVLRRAIEDLSLSAVLVPCGIKRDADGLCESSRNAKLSPADRAAAPELFRALCAAVAMIEAGERDAGTVTRFLAKRISAVAKLDYVQVVEATSLDRVDPLAGDLRLLVSADFNGVHLFDNIGVSVAA